MDVKPIAHSMLKIYGGTTLSTRVRALNRESGKNMGPVMREVLLSSFYHPHTRDLPHEERGKHAELVEEVNSLVREAPDYERLKEAGKYNMLRAVESAQTICEILTEVLQYAPPPPPPKPPGGSPGDTPEDGEGGDPGLFDHLTDQQLESLKERISEKVTEAAGQAEKDDKILRMFGKGNSLDNAASQMACEEVVTILKAMRKALPAHVLEMLGSFYTGIISNSQECQQDGERVEGIKKVTELEDLLSEELMLLGNPNPNVRCQAVLDFFDGELHGELRVDGIPGKDGDFTIAVDKSGSMSGSTFEIASAIGCAALAVAHNEGRTCRGYVFDGWPHPLDITDDLIKNAQALLDWNPSGGTSINALLGTFLEDGGGDLLLITDACDYVDRELWERVNDQGDVVVIHIGSYGYGGTDQAFWTSEHELYHMVPELSSTDPSIAKHVAKAFDRKVGW